MTAGIGTAGWAVPVKICERCGEFEPHACVTTVAPDYVKWVKSWSRRPQRPREPRRPRPSFEVTRQPAAHTTAPAQAGKHHAGAAYPQPSH